MKNVTIQLPADQADALQAVAAGSGGNAAKLAAWIVGEWVGRLPSEETPPHSKETANRRMMILQRWWQLRKRRGASAYSAFATLSREMSRKGFKVGRTALYDWERKWREGGLAGLADRHYKPALNAVPKAFIDRVKELLRAGRGRRVSECHRQAAHEFRGRGEAVASYRTTARQLGRNCKTR
jgi:transposase